MIQMVDYIRVLPELVLTLFGVAVMMAEAALPPRASRKPLGWLAFIGTLAALAATIYQARFPGTAFFDMVQVDSFSIFFHFLIAFIAALVVLASFEYLDAQQIRAGEYYALILFGAVGMVLMSSAVELVLIFIALEISSISTYVLAGFRRRAPSSIESSVKYFLLGSFATAFFLYGVALMFGATGTTRIYMIADAIQSGQHSAMVFTAVALMFVGIGFKVAAAPFHVWTPDVYEGAPAPIVGLMSTAPKAAAFAVLLRIFFAAATPGWFWPVWIAAALSMTLGNISALVQDNVKRLLAYSSIAHAGYLLVAFAAARQIGISAAMFYTAAYAFMNVGAFAVVSHFASAGERYVSLEDYAGLGRRSPVLAATLTIFLLSLIGIPITGGFFAKFYVFSAALQSNLVWLVIIAVVNSAIAAYYYLRIIVLMYMRDAKETAPAVRSVSAPLGIALALSVAATIYLGVLPGRVLDYTSRGAALLVRQDVSGLLAGGRRHYSTAVVMSRPAKIQDASTQSASVSTTAIATGRQSAATWCASVASETCAIIEYTGSRFPHPPPSTCPKAAGRATASAVAAVANSGVRNVPKNSATADTSTAVTAVMASSIHNSSKLACALRTSQAPAIPMARQ
jgi:NADH-quinone oxidoreductase subunit N